MLGSDFDKDFDSLWKSMSIFLVVSGFVTLVILAVIAFVLYHFISKVW